MENYKIIVLGRSNVGKTSLTIRFTKNDFQKAMNYTIGVDVESSIIKIDNKDIRLDIWDTAGQERFSCIVQNYYRNVDAVILVFDCKDKTSFDYIIKLKEKFNKNLVKIVGNKSDLGICKFTKDCYFTSALTGENVNKLFYDIAKELVDNNKNKIKKKKFKLKFNKFCH